MLHSIRNLQIFDLDETFFRMPSYTSKKHVESDSVKFETPYSFYDHPKSLCEESHHIQLIGPVYDAWKEAWGKGDTYSVLITHRVEELRETVEALLASRKVIFNETYFLGRKSKKTGTTARLLEPLINLERVQIFEDSIAQIYDYQEFFRSLNEERARLGMAELNIEIHIVDKSRVFQIENVKISQKRSIVLV